MEMSATELLNRFVNMPVNDEIPALEYLRLRPESARTIVHEKIAPVYTDRLLITQNTGLTARDYDILLEQASKDYGPVDILIPDGLSMMGGDGSETELVNQHTRELKQLAIRWNIFIPLIVHVTKEALLDKKNLASLARGSEKIIDNCDFHISMSLVSKSEAFDESDMFETDLGRAFLVNKRGSGNKSEVIYYFDQKRLLMEERSPRQ
jgi:hypothetical protein